MRRLVRVFVEVLSVSLRRELAHRANLFFEVVMTAVAVGAGLGALGIVFSRADTLAGWTLAEAVVLLGTYQIVSGLLSTFIEPNLMWFSAQVVAGKLDEVLLRPVPSILLASLGACAPLQLSQVVLGAAVVALGLARAGGVPSPWGGLAWLALLGAAAAATWATRVLLASLSFWAPHTDLDVLYGALWQCGRYPVAIYRQPIRALLTYVFPVALISSLPAQALMRPGNAAAALLVGVAAATALVSLACWAWRAGLRRYTSATS